MAKRRRAGSTGWIIFAAVICVVAAAAVTYFITRDRGGDVVTGDAPVGPIPGPPPGPEPRKVTIYLPVVGDNRFYLEPVTRTTSMKGSTLDVAMKTLLSTTSEPGEAGRLIPQGTELLYPVDVEGGTATVDLSKEFVDNFSGGSTQESLVLNAVAHTLVANGDGRVSRVQVLVEGDKAESLGGHFGLADPITPDHTLLKRGSGS